MNSNDQRIAELKFASVYPHYVEKVQKKGRTLDELHEVIKWLTGFNDFELRKCIDEKITFSVFFERAKINERAHLITGSICGYKIETIENELTKKVRYLDKLVDELAKGKQMDKILR